MKKLKFTEVKISEILNQEPFEVKMKGILITTHIVKIGKLRFVFEEDNAVSLRPKKFVLFTGEANIPYDTAELYSDFIYDGESFFLYQV